MGKHFTKNVCSFKLINKFNLESNSSAKRPKKSFNLINQHVPADRGLRQNRLKQLKFTVFHRATLYARADADPRLALGILRVPWILEPKAEPDTWSTHPSGVRQDHCYYPYYLKQMAHHVCFSPKYPTVYWKNSIIPARILPCDTPDTHTQLSLW